VDLVLTLAGFGVGIVVGLTGMGGGALMTPLLVLVFGVPPLAAVSSDLVASAVMKPFGGWVHARRGTVNWSLVRWLCLGSIPCAFLGVLLTKLVPNERDVQQAVQYALGGALLLAVIGLVAKAYAGRHRPDHGGAAASITVRPVPTVLLGALGGLVVGLTSVGSGSLIIVILLALYPALRPNDLVGTDLVQAVPLVAAAALGHVFLRRPAPGPGGHDRARLGSRRAAGRPAVVAGPVRCHPGRPRRGAARQRAEAVRRTRSGGARGGGGGGRGRGRRTGTATGHPAGSAAAGHPRGGQHQCRRHGVLQRVRSGHSVPLRVVTQVTHPRRLGWGAEHHLA
jgi:uncharacterized membrane protein YfcA